MYNKCESNRFGVSILDKVEKRKAFIINVVYLLMFVAAFYLFMKYAFWMFLPFLMAFFVSAILQKPLKLLTKSKKAPKGLIGTILSLVVYSLIIGVFVLGGVKLGSSIRDIVTYFTNRCTNLAEFFEVLKNVYLNLDIAKMIPPEFNDYITNGIDTLRDYFLNGDFIVTLKSNISSVLSPLGSVISTVPSFFAGFLVMIVATCFMTATFDDIKKFIFLQFKNGEKVSRAKHILISSLGKMLKAYTLIIIITTAELFIGLSVLKFFGINDGAHNLIISFTVAIIDIVPVLGTGTVLIPWSIYSFVTGQIGMGIGLLVIYAIITVIRQIIEPKLVAGQVGISPVVTIMAMYIGIKVFGAIGIFILPFIVIVIKLLNDEGVIHLFNSKSNVSELSANDSDSEKAE